jgi:hypothetical protein
MMIVLLHAGGANNGRQMPQSSADLVVASLHRCGTSAAREVMVHEVGHVSIDGSKVKPPSP